MEEQWKKWKDKTLHFIGGDKKKKLLLFLGIGGMILLMLSEWIPAKSKSSDPNKDSSSPKTTAAGEPSYARQMEEKLTAVVGKISGVGACQVFLTLENGTESVYAQNSENSESKDTSGDEKNDTYEYVIIKGENGEEALKVKEIEPRIRGVMVVCEGGEDTLVRQRITEAMTAVFDISSTRVSITKMQSQ